VTLCLLLFAGLADGQATLSILPQFAFGGGWYTALYFSNPNSVVATLSVNFFDDLGAPLIVPAFKGSSAVVQIPANGTAVLEAPNVGPLVQGYATFVLPINVIGYGVFRQSVPDRPDQEAVVPFAAVDTQRTNLTWDERDRVTAMSLVNASTSDATVTATVWDESGTQVIEKSLNLMAGRKAVGTLAELLGIPGITNKKGSARFETVQGNLNLLGFRFGGAAFTSIPESRSAVYGVKPVFQSMVAAVVESSEHYNLLIYVEPDGSGANYRAEIYGVDLAGSQRYFAFTKGTLSGTTLSFTAPDDDRYLGSTMTLSYSTTALTNGGAKATGNITGSLATKTNGLPGIQPATSSLSGRFDMTN
jgi:hypothetical protein